MASGAAIGAIGVSEAPVEKKVWNHGTTPSLSGETGGLYRILESMELSTFHRIYGSVPQLL